MPRIKTTITVSDTAADRLEYKSAVIGVPVAKSIAECVEKNLSNLNSRERVELLQARRKNGGRRSLPIAK